MTTDNDAGPLWRLAFTVRAFLQARGVSEGPVTLERALAARAWACCDDLPGPAVLEVFRRAGYPAPSTLWRYPRTLSTLRDSELSDLQKRLEGASW